MTASRETGQQPSVWNLGWAKEPKEMDKEDKQPTEARHCKPGNIYRLVKTQETQQLGNSES